MGSVDMELKKQFEELNVQMKDTKQKVTELDSNINNLRTGVKRSQMTKTEISNLPEHVNTYESIGRMFVLRKTGDMIDILNEKITSSEGKITGMEDKKEQLVKSIDERRENIRDLVNKKKNEN